MASVATLPVIFIAFCLVATPASSVNTTADVTATAIDTTTDAATSTATVAAIVAATATDTTTATDAATATNAATATDTATATDAATATEVTATDTSNAVISTTGTPNTDIMQIPDNWQPENSLYLRSALGYATKFFASILHFRFHQIRNTELNRDFLHERNFVFNPFEIASVILFSMRGLQPSFDLTEIYDFFQFRRAGLNPDILDQAMEEFTYHENFNPGYEVTREFRIKHGVFLNQNFELLKNFSRDVKIKLKTTITNVSGLAPHQIKTQMKNYVINVTKGLIELNLDNLTEFVMIDIGSTYISAQWQQELTDDEGNDRLFNCMDEDKKYRMKSNIKLYQTWYVDLHDRFAVVIPLKDGDTGLLLYVPKTHKLFQTLDKDMKYIEWTKIISQMRTKGNTFVQVTFPLFQANFTRNVKYDMEQQNVKSLFVKDVLNWSRMTEERHIFVDKIFHTSFITMDEKKIQFASITYLTIARELHPGTTVNSTLKFVSPSTDTLLNIAKANTTVISKPNATINLKNISKPPKSYLTSTCKNVKKTSKSIIRNSSSAAYTIKLSSPTKRSSNSSYSTSPAFSTKLASVFTKTVKRIQLRYTSSPSQIAKKSINKYKNKTSQSKILNSSGATYAIKLSSPQTRIFKRNDSLGFFSRLVRKTSKHAQLRYTASFSPSPTETMSHTSRAKLLSAIKQYCQKSSFNPEAKKYLNHTNNNSPKLAMEKAIKFKTRLNSQTTKGKTKSYLCERFLTNSKPISTVSSPDMLSQETTTHSKSRISKFALFKDIDSSTKGEKRNIKQTNVRGCRLQSRLKTTNQFFSKKKYAKYQRFPLSNVLNMNEKSKTGWADETRTFTAWTILSTVPTASFDEKDANRIVIDTSFFYAIISTTTDFFYGVGKVSYCPDNP